MTDGHDNYSFSIRTPDQRLRVFVSSTLAELADERAAVARAIEAIRLTPVLFELGARPHPPRELYRAYLAQSDIFVGLYWERYGWIGPDMDISGLEDEFRLSGSIPRLFYVKTPAPDREPQLAAMIGELEKEGTESYRTFRTPDELEQLVEDDLALLLSERFAGTAAQTASAPRHKPSLPTTSTSLIGRDHDITEVAELLASPDARLVTLTGPGGIGKTRLAIAVGEQVEDRYPDGVEFVALASVTDPELVMSRIAAAVGAPIEGSRSAIDAVVEYFAERSTLLVVDNLEQVVAVAPELDELLTQCAGLEILATSRTVLRLRAEHEYPVSPLTVPARSDGSPGDQLASLPAVQLFVDRAQAVRYDFALTDDNALVVAEICRRLDGLPLAIELAAARIRLLDAAGLLARLGESLDALGTGPVDLPERQRTLRATVEWSIELLDHDGEKMLATLSVFVDGWTVDAATQVSGRSEVDTLDLLDALAGHSLVTIEATDTGPRFRMLEAVRELAAERLAARADAPDVERAHAEYFGARVENADWPAERQAEWAKQLRDEEGNLERAIRWYLVNDIAPLPHIFRILWLFWQLRDGLPESRSWIEELERKADTLDDRARAELLLSSAITAVEVGDDATALDALDAIEGLEAQIDDPALASAAQLAVSWILPIRGEAEGALRAASSAGEGFRRRNDPSLGWAALTAGIVELTLGLEDDARTHLSEARDLGRKLDNSWLESTAASQLAGLEVRTGDLDEARALLAASVDGRDVAELNSQALTFSLVALAQLALAEHDPHRAATALGAAVGLRTRIGLVTWPSMRQNEAELVARVKDAFDGDGYDDAFTTGSVLDRRDAVALVRGDG